MSLKMQESYDKIAEEYAVRYNHELEHKPFDRQILKDFSEHVRGTGPVCDLGCGPGQIAQFLTDQGLHVTGVDLSPSMVRLASQLHPNVHFEVGDMRVLKYEDNFMAGITAFYSIIHIERDDLPSVFTEFYRVLKPGGFLLFSIHLGFETVRIEELWGKAVDIDFLFFSVEEMESHVLSSGLEIVKISERGPYSENVEYQSQRAYFLCKKSEVIH